MCTRSPRGQCEADLWPCGCDLCGLGVLWVTDWARLDRGSLFSGRLMPFDVCSLRHTNSWCFYASLPVPHYSDRPPNLKKNVLAGLYFLKNAVHLSIAPLPSPSGPLLTWETLCWLRSACLVCGILWVCGLVIGDSWEPSRSQIQSINIIENNSHVPAAALLQEVNKCFSDHFTRDFSNSGLFKHVFFSSTISIFLVPY